MRSKSVRKREPNWARELLKEGGIKDINGLPGFIDAINTAFPKQRSKGVLFIKYAILLSM